MPCGEARERAGGAEAHATSPRVMLISPMVYRALTGLACLSLAGCFEEPPPAASNESSASSGVGSTSSTSSDETSGSSGDPGSSSSTGEELLCMEDPVETGRVPADVVVIVGEASDLPTGALDNFSPETSVAIIAPISVTSLLAEFFPPGCDNGCDGCATPNRVLVPYGNAVGAAFAAFFNEEFDCVFRGPPPDISLSEPSRHVWLFTQDPAMPLPPMIGEKMIALGLRLHVACPGCGPALPNPMSDLGKFVAQTNGTIADSDGSLAVQSDILTAPRTSCIWADDGEPPLVFDIVNPVLPALAINNDAVELGPCEEVVEVEPGVEELFPLYFENDNGDVQLCPVACRIAQLPHADETNIYGCYGS